MGLWHVPLAVYIFLMLELCDVVSLSSFGA